MKIGHCIRRHHNGALKPELSTLAQVTSEIAESEYDLAQIQVTPGPNRFTVDLSGADDIESAKSLLGQKKLFVHCPYGINLARETTDRSLPTQKRCIQEIVNLVKQMDGGAVLHIGKTLYGGISDIHNSINSMDLTGSNTPPLLLENAAGQGTDIGYTWDQIRKVFEGIDNTSGVGLCIDTQHAYAAGMCDFSTSKSVIKLFDISDEIVPTGISLIHLNDSSKSFGSRVDRHCSIGKGYIWEKETTSLLQLCVLCSQEDVPMVLETKTPNDVSVVRDFYSKHS